MLPELAWQWVQAGQAVLVDVRSDAEREWVGYVPGAAVVYDPYWDAHQAFLALPKDVQTAFAIRMLFTHRPVDRYGASMFLHYQRGFNVKFEGIGANQY